MTPQEMLDEFADNGFSDTSLARKLSDINDTIWDICSRHPWPFLEKSIDLVFNGVSSVATNFPSDFRALLSLSRDGNQLQYVPVGQVDKDYGSLVDEVDMPRAYFLQNGTIRFVPIPTATTVIRMRYLQWPVAVTDTSPESAVVIPARHGKVIVFGALWKLYEREDDPELAARYETHYESRILQMMDELQLQQYDQSNFILVTDYDGYDGYNCWW